MYSVTVVGADFQSNQVEATSDSLLKAKIKQEELGVASAWLE